MMPLRRHFSSATWVRLGAVASVLLIAHAACQPTESQVVVGRAYLEERDCMGERAAIDVVDGANPDKKCEPVCMVGSSPLVGGDGDGGAVFVTDQCPPLPPTFDVSGSDPRCADALAAFTREDYCAGSGSSNPRDAGTDAESEEPTDAQSEEHAADADAQSEEHAADADTDASVQNTSF